MVYREEPDDENAESWKLLCRFVLLYLFIWSYYLKEKFKGQQGVIYFLIYQLQLDALS